MTTLREAAEQALDALNNLGVQGNWKREEAAVAALREALAQPEPEPVAWMDRDGDIYPMPETEGWRPPHTLLYTHPPQRKPLTDAEIEAEFYRKCWVTVQFADGTYGIALDRVTVRDFARAIERAHGIGGEE